MSKIEWTEKTWNPIVGCTKVSAGCKNCYAIRMAWRLQHIHHSKDKYAGTVEKTAGGQLNWTGKVNLPNINDEPFSDRSDLLLPLTWKKPQMVFVNSMSDLFHEDIPFEVIDCIFAIMACTPQHTYQVLTKRPARMVEYFSAEKQALIKRWVCAVHSSGLTIKGDTIENSHAVFNAYEQGWPLKNIWLGVSVENQQGADERIPLLLQVPAAVRFLSCEPLLGPITLSRHAGDINPACITCSGKGEINGIKCPRQCKDGKNPFSIDWVIVGGESGKDARPMHTHWARKLRDQCQKAGVSFFFKQWGEWVERGQEPAFIPGVKVRDVRNILVDGTEYKEGYINCGDLACVKKVGKHLSGRLLDGREWNEFPGQKPVPADDDPDLYFTSPD